MPTSPDTPPPGTPPPGTPPPGTPATGRSSATVALLGIILVAINLRPAITSVGPVLPLLGDALDLDVSQLGLLGALPVATFAATSGIVQQLIARFGVERVTAAAMLTLTGATLWRSWPGPDANLWIGTILVGAAIAVGNVTVPVLVKRSFPHSTARVTSIYVAVLGLCAGLAAALAVPIADATNWRWALGVWAILTVAATAYWGVHALRSSVPSGGSSVPLTRAGTPLVGVWRSPVAWWITVYMGIQAGVFYIALTWLPTAEQHLGVSPTAAGWHMLVLQIAGVVGNLAAPRLMALGTDHRFAALLPGIFSLTAVSAMFLAPGLIGVWVAVLGLGTGGSFVVALSLVATRAPDLATAGSVSAMSQSVGYGLTAVLLYAAGLVAGLNTTAVLAMIALAGAGVVASGLMVGRMRMIDGSPAHK